MVDAHHWPCLGTCHNKEWWMFCSGQFDMYLPSVERVTLTAEVITRRGFVEPIDPAVRS
jgi:hypothetical protein